MDLTLPGVPVPPRAVRALAAFVRERLEQVSDTLTPLWRRDGELPSLAGEDLVAATARQFATVVVGAAAPFAPTSYARARLIRQMHASGLLTDAEARHTETLLDGVDGPAYADPLTGVGAHAATGTDVSGVPRRRPRPGH